MARDLVKLHMTIIITAEDSDKKHLIGYPSEPMLSEGVLTLLSRPDVELEVLKELDLVRKEGGVINTGNRGDLCARILLLSARRRQILSFRKENCEVHIETLICILYIVVILLYLLLCKELSNILCLSTTYDMGFTHFVMLDHIPDESTLQLCWDRGAAIIYQRNQPDADIALREFLQLKDCIFSSLLIMVNWISEAYANNLKFETYHYGEGRNRHGNMMLNFSNTNDTKKTNRLTECFQLSIALMLPKGDCHIPSSSQVKEINNDNDEDIKDYLINKRWKSDEQAEQDEEWPEEYE
ncbi:15835_t:CDS:2, partial [Funneliformis caledonium]